MRSLRTDTYNNNNKKNKTKNVRKSNKILHTHMNIWKKCRPVEIYIENHIVFGWFYYLIKSYDYFFLFGCHFFFWCPAHIFSSFFRVGFSMWTHINVWSSKKVLISSIQNYQQVHNRCVVQKKRVSNAIYRLRNKKKKHQIRTRFNQ